MARTSHDYSSSSKRHFHWTSRVGTEEEAEQEQVPIPSKTTNASPELKKVHSKSNTLVSSPRKKLPSVAIARLKSVLASIGKNRTQSLSVGLGTRVIIGTLFGSRKGHVHFAIQREPSSAPSFLVELATPISGLVREMASGLVRIALECDKEEEEGHVRRGHADREKKASVKKLLEEPVWRTYCNGKKCGFATKRECGVKEWKVLKLVEPITMGAGVIPSDIDQEATASGGGGEVMYMRAKFERIVGSRDSEAFYMMNPDSTGTPELSIYLLRI